MDSLNTLKLKKILLSSVETHKDIFIGTVCEFLTNWESIPVIWKETIVNNRTNMNFILDDSSVVTLILQIALDGNYDNLAAHSLYMRIEEMWEMGTFK